VYAYAILINKFEYEFRKFLADEVLLTNFGNNWMRGIPKGVRESALEATGLNTFNDPSDLLDYVGFPHLKEIASFDNNYSLCSDFLGKIPKAKFNEIMDELNELRNKVAHVRRSFSLLDFDMLVDYVKLLGRGKSAGDVREYIDQEQYREFQSIPPGFVIQEEELNVTSNLPPEDYSLEGGFVGRRDAKKKLTEILYSDLDRVITLIGSGGVGKTALALNVSYSIRDDVDCPFTAIVWFSAKTSMLTPKGIIETVPEIRNYEEFVRKTIRVLQPEHSSNLESSLPLHNLGKYLQTLLSTNRVLMIVDNLESVMIEDSSLVEFLKDVPRPSKVLITSRVGLGEIERRFFLDEMSANDAILLFRLVCRDKGLKDYSKLREGKIEGLVDQVQKYPLAIKWSIAEAALGKDLNAAFKMPLKGTSDIAKFCFEDVFAMLSEKARMCLYGISLFDTPPSVTLIRYLIECSDSDFLLVIRELILASFVFPCTIEGQEGSGMTAYGLLSLTQDYVQEKLNDEQEIRTTLNDRFYRLQELVEQEEKAKSISSYSVYSLGVKTPEDRIAVKLVKSAKGLYQEGRVSGAEELFRDAMEVAPNFTYVLIEFARFEFERGRFKQVEKLMEKAANLEPKNLHVWYQWGIIRKRQHSLKDAEIKLRTGLAIDNDHPNLNIELGRVLTFRTRYDEAQTILQRVLVASSIITNRQKLIVLSHLADNSRRWAQTEKKRGNQNEAIGLFEESVRLSNEAIALLPNRRNYDFWRSIHRDYGIALSQMGKLNEGQEYLELSISVVQGEGRDITPDREFEAGVNFFLAVYETKRHKPDSSKIEKFVQTGLSIVPPTSKYKRKLQSLSKEIRGMKNRAVGRIRFFNTRKGFGLIDSSEMICAFRVDNLRNPVKPKDCRKLDGVHVSFIPEQNSEFKVGFIATDIELVS
jgi:tetratricopeptide (TPR) repeat protein